MTEASLGQGVQNANVAPEGWGEAKPVASAWFKFEKVGDKIKGTLINKYLKESKNPAFKAQWVYELKTEDGSVFSVGVSVEKEGMVRRLQNCKLGEIIGLWFKEEIEPKQKGLSPAKSIQVFTFGMDPTYTGMEGGEEVSPEQAF